MVIITVEKRKKKLWVPTLLLLPLILFNSILSRTRKHLCWRKTKINYQTSKKENSDEFWRLRENILALLNNLFLIYFRGSQMA